MKEETTSSLLDIQIFTNKMLLSTSKQHKDIILFTQNTGTIAHVYTDDNMRTFIPQRKLQVIDSCLFSEHFLYLHDNKTLLTVWNTNSTAPHCKFTITDETITAFTVDVDGVLIAGTATGKVVVHDVAVGNAVKNISFGNKEICAITRFGSNLVLVLDKEKISALLFGDMLNNANTSKEAFVLYFKEGECYDNVCVACGKVYMFNSSCVVEMEVDDNEGKFVVRKMFYVNNEHVYDVKVKWNEMYFTNKKNEVYLIDLSKYTDEDKHYVNVNKEMNVLIRNTTKTNCGCITLFTFGMDNAMLTGHEDGKICVWKRNSSVKGSSSVLYYLEQTFPLHKGPVTNIVLLNKPISQYGLNFNNKVSECQVSQTQNNKELTTTQVKQNEAFAHYVSNYISSYNNSTNNIHM